jgi:hypothetical protein
MSLSAGVIRSAKSCLILRDTESSEMPAVVLQWVLFPMSMNELAEVGRAQHLRASQTDE